MTLYKIFKLNLIRRKIDRHKVWLVAVTKAKTYFPLYVVLGIQTNLVDHLQKQQK